MVRYSARWVLPVTSAPIRGGVVACDEGVITYVGPRDAAPEGEDYELGDAVLMPGLVNTHTHLELTMMRGFLEELPFTEWIDVLRRARTEVLRDDMLLDAARLGIIEGIEHGITTFADTCSSGVVMRAMRELKVRGIMYQEVFGPDPALAEASLADLRERVAQLRQGQTALVSLGISPHAPYTVSDALYRSAASFARSEKLPLAFHIAESADEIALVTRGEGIFAERARKRGIATPVRAVSPVALLEANGCLGTDSLLIHAVHCGDEDIRTIVRNAAPVAHCPVSNARLGHGVAPLIEMIRAGATVGLGTDSVASNNRMDVLDEARVAALIHAACGVGRSGYTNGSESPTAESPHPSPVTAELALELATIRGAKALGLADRIGSLEVGKAADLTAFSLAHARSTPSENPVATVIHSLAGSRALLVMVAGERLVEDCEAVIDPGSLRQRVATVAQALAEWRERT